MKKYYDLLGVNHQSTIDDIEKAYRSRLEALDVLPVDDKAYIEVKRKRLKEAYCAVLLHRETGKVLPDDFEGGADAVEQMLVKARLEKSGKPKSVKIKSKNKGNWMVLVLIVAVLGVAVELIPVKRFEPAQYVDLSQYEQAEERDLHIAEIAEASKQYILEYAEEHPREYVQGGTLRGDSRKTARCEREFLETYWGCESFGEVADILNETYEGFECDSSYDVGCEDAVYAFYGFLPYTDIMGYRNPFHGGLIEWSYQLYLYYVQFYEAYENGEIPK